MSEESDMNRHSSDLQFSEIEILLRSLVPRQLSIDRDALFFQAGMAAALAGAALLTVAGKQPSDPAAAAHRGASHDASRGPAVPLERHRLGQMGPGSRAPGGHLTARGWVPARPGSADETIGPARPDASAAPLAPMRAASYLQLLRTELGHDNVKSA
jgi:hypothetical protein